MSIHFHFCPTCVQTWEHDERTYVGKCGMQRRAVCDDCQADVEVDELVDEYENNNDDIDYASSDEPDPYGW